MAKSGMKFHTTVRIGEEGFRLLSVFQRKWGIGQNAVLELSLRALAEKEGVAVLPSEPEANSTHLSEAELERRTAGLVGRSDNS